MTVKCMYFSKKYNSKPDGKEVAVIQNSLKPVDMDIRDLAAGLAQGCTFRPAVLKGKTKDSFQFQELFAVDFDHNSTINETLKLCKDLKLIPVFAYTSFRHLQVDGEHRFRLVFHSSRPITDYVERDKIQLALMRAFSKSDPQCKNADRLFFGGRQLICENYDFCFDPDDIINRFYEAKPSNKQQASINNKPKAKRKISEFDDTHFEKIEAIRKLDVAAMRRLLGFDDTCNDSNDEIKNNINLSFITTPNNVDIVTNIMGKVKKRFGIGINEILTLSQGNQLLNILDFIYNELNKQSTDTKLEISINDNQDYTLNSERPREKAD